MGVHGPVRECMESFPADFFDVVNVGAAIPVPPKLVSCMREGAVLLIPEPRNEQLGGFSTEKHDAQFCVFQKTKGKLQGPLEAFGVRFIKTARLSALDLSISLDLDLV